MNLEVTAAFPTPSGGCGCQTLKIWIKACGVWFLRRRLNTKASGVAILAAGTRKPIYWISRIRRGGVVYLDC